MGHHIGTMSLGSVAAGLGVAGTTLADRIPAILAGVAGVIVAITGLIRLLRERQKPSP